MNGGYDATMLQGRIGEGVGGRLDGASTGSGGSGSGSGSGSSSSPWSLSAYQHLFDVDTSTVLYRTGLSLAPLPPLHRELDSFISHLAEAQGGDLYGPIWVTSTTIFAFFVFSSLRSSIDDYLAGEVYSYDFRRLTYATSIAATYGLGLPTGLWLLVRWFKVDLAWLVLMDLYGYGLAIWVPVAAICIIPLNTLRWTIFGLATLLSGGFILANVYRAINEAENKSSRSLFVIITACHLLLALLIKFGLF